MSVIKNNRKNIEYYNKIYIVHYKFVDMSKREVYDKHNNPKENDFDRN